LSPYETAQGRSWLFAEKNLFERNIKMSSEGVVTSRQCPLCGHHEIGYVTQDGVFRPLQPGTRIQMLEKPQAPQVSERHNGVFQAVCDEEVMNRSKYKVWIPEPVKGIQRCRLKYGVMLEEASFAEEISKDVYGFAYLEKLQRLIQKEIHIPIAVLLDRYFASPHLATGNSRQIASALWQELDEIRSPVALVGDWLEKRNEVSVNMMIQPVLKEGIVDQPVNKEEQHRELQNLSLEEFLELL
jgi:hypothetical protein